ncbi:phage tail tape measure protein [Tuanshanicoccus lijuaniae]|uniref:phage tail tape measure protein n=1 Tax=Aerococcaceae bacterium zg-1292 TaxID=2774330 RepID=UPI001937EFDF|nr:phage tail tape measure protein [Aerococcaceae bacterium zg-1292]QQA38058.1 phage tail tape measure protein [Aerococcaceae bacterium zg-1292]
MSRRIKGITIELGGDTTKLQTALKQVNREIKDTQRELKDVERLLKLDPHNTELLAQKQALVTQAIDGTNEKLETLKTASEQAYEALNKGEITKQQFDALQREIIETEQTLKHLESELKNVDSSFQATLKNAGEKMTQTGETIKGVGTTLTKNVTAPIVGIGAASIAAFSQIDEGYDIIIKKTGVAGEEFEALKKVADNVFRSLPVEMVDVGTAVGEINTRFKVTDAELENLTVLFLKFAEINETDVNATIGNTHRLMTQWGISTSETAAILGLLTSKAQETGISVEQLINGSQQYGSIMKEMGLNLTQSIELLAQFEANGVNADQALMGLKKAVQTYTAQGLSMDEALRATIQSIKEAASETEALAIASQIFGSRGALEMTKGIREGRISLDELSKSMTNYGEVVNETYAGTYDGIDNFKVAMNNLKSVLAELGAVISDVLGPILLVVAKALGTLASWFGHLPVPVKQVIVMVGLLVAAIGPLLVIFGTIVAAVGQAITGFATLSGVFASVGGAITATLPVIVSIGAPLLAIVAVVWSVIEVGNYLIANWEEIKQAASQTWQAVAQKIQSWMNQLQHGMTQTWHRIKNTTMQVWQSMQQYLTGLWQSMSQTLSAVWQQIVQQAQTFWTQLLQTIQWIGQSIWQSIETVWKAILSFIITVVNSIVNGAIDGFASLLSGIQSVMGNITQAIANGFNQAVQFIFDVMGQAYGWGVDFIQGFVNGIWNSMSSVVHAVKSVADTVWSYLHFTVPEVGPLTDYETWMPDFMKGLSKGIEQSRHLVRQSVENVANDMIMRPAESVSPHYSVDVSAITQAIQGIAVESPSPSFESIKDIVIPVYVGGTLLDEVIVNAQMRQAIRSGGRS